MENQKVISSSSFLGVILNKIFKKERNTSIVCEVSVRQGSKQEALNFRTLSLYKTFSFPINI